VDLITLFNNSYENSLLNCLGRPGTYILREDELKKTIDLTTTFYRLWDVPETCLMYKFAKKKLHEEGENFEYKPEDGYGYYKVNEAELESIPSHKKVILMDKVCKINMIL
jgi:hypothetical protein